MPFISQRRPRGPGRFLQWKVWLFSAGAILLLVGMARNLDLLVATAIAVLAVAFLLRFFERDEEDEAADEDDFAGEDEPAGDEASPTAAVVDDSPNGTDDRRPIG